MTFDVDTPLRIFAHAVITDRRGRLFLLHRATADDDAPGCWEVPGGPLRPGEGVLDALVHRVRAGSGLDIRPGRLIGAVRGDTPEGRVVRLILAADTADGPIVLSGGYDACRWVTPKGLGELPLAEWLEQWYRGQRT